MNNKHTFLASASAALAATASLGLMPAASAADIYMNPNAAITKQWQKNAEAYGKPLSKELCATGAGCAQQFENAVITWSRNTGVKVLSGAERAQAYMDAGGVKTLGALESDAWNNSFCGPSVTTFNGSNSSRWLLVVDEGKASVGSKIDLKSEVGQKWLAERAQTKQCFDATDVGAEDWSQSQGFTDLVNTYASTIPITLGQLQEPLKAVDDTLAVQRHEFGSLIINKNTGKVVPIENSVLEYYLQNRAEYGLPISGEVTPVYGSKISIDTWFATDANHKTLLGVRNGVIEAYEYSRSKAGTQFAVTGPIEVDSADDPRPEIANLSEKLAQSSISHYVESLTSVDLGQATDQIHAIKFKNDWPLTYYVQNFSHGYTVIFNGTEDQVSVMETELFKLALEKNLLQSGNPMKSEFVDVDGDQTPETQTYFIRRGVMSCDIRNSAEGFALRLAADQKTLVQTDWELADTAQAGCVPTLTDSARPLEIPANLFKREAVQGGVVDTSVNWYVASTASRQQALFYFDSKTKERWIVAAGEDGKPLPGAKAFKSSLFDVDFVGPEYNQEFANDQFKEWCGHWAYPKFTDMSLLGVPVAEEKTTTINGAKVLSQEFESGTLSYNFSTKKYSIAWNENGLAKKAWYDSLGI